MKKLLVFLCTTFISIAHADTETINWYVDGVLYDTTNCQSGNDIILPTPPTKTDYTFVGWKTVFDFSTLDYSISGNNSTYDASAMTWVTNFSYGKVSGIALCSSTNGTQAVAGTPDESGDGQYCWCKATTFSPSDSDLILEPISSLSWVFNIGRTSVSQCLSLCAGNCSSIKNNSDFRRALFRGQ